MAIGIANFVLETVNAPGTSGTLNLAGTIAGRMAFASAFATGTTVFYFLDDGTWAEWGYGVLTIGSPNTLTRAKVLGNTAGTTARLNFTGTTRVYNEVPASKLACLDATGNLAVAAPGAFQGMGTIPIGAPVPWCGIAVTVPVGFILADGRAVSRTTYAALYAALGGSSSVWGQGDGSTTFNVPDLRGRGFIGADDFGTGAAGRATGVAAGWTGGEWTHTLTTAELATHNHGVTDPGHNHYTEPHNHGVTDPGHRHNLMVGGISGANYAQLANGYSSMSSTETAVTNIAINLNGVTVDYSLTGITTTQSAGSGTAHNNVQPSAAGFWMIYAGA